MNPKNLRNVVAAGVVIHALTGCSTTASSHVTGAKGPAWERVEDPQKLRSIPGTYH